MREDCAKREMKKKPTDSPCIFTECNTQTVLDQDSDRRSWLNFAIFPASRKKDKNATHEWAELLR